MVLESTICSVSMSVISFIGLRLAVAVVEPYSAEIEANWGGFYLCAQVGVCIRVPQLHSWILPCRLSSDGFASIYISFEGRVMMQERGVNYSKLAYLNALYLRRIKFRSYYNPHPVNFAVHFYHCVISAYTTGRLHNLAGYLLVIHEVGRLHSLPTMMNKGNGIHE